MLRKKPGTKGETTSVLFKNVLRADEFGQENICKALDMQNKEVNDQYFPH